MITINDYHVNENTNESILSKNGFRYGTLKKFVFKDLIQLIVHIDLETFDWDYQVWDVCNNSYYMGYYDREYGRNEIAKKIDKKVNDIINELERKEILIKDGDE